MSSDTLVTRDGRVVELPSLEEDARITAAAMSDPDCPPLTDEFFNNAYRWRDRYTDPRSPLYKGAVLPESDSVQAFKATGEGWQDRIQRVLSDWLRTHSPMDA